MKINEEEEEDIFKFNPIMTSFEVYRRRDQRNEANLPHHNRWGEKVLVSDGDSSTCDLSGLNIAFRLRRRPLEGSFDSCPVGCLSKHL